MSQTSVRFNPKDQPEFYKELRQRVNAYFTDNNISKHADSRMMVKTIFMLSLYCLPLIAMLSGVVQSFWPMMLMWTLMGFGMSGIGLSVMHDANHGAYSQQPKVNRIIGGVLIARDDGRALRDGWECVGKSDSCASESESRRSCCDR